MKLEYFGKLKDSVEAFESKKEAMQKNKRKAASDLDEARKQLREVVAAAGKDRKDMASSVVTAQAHIAIAEEALRQAEEELAAVPEKPLVVEHSYNFLGGLIRSFISNRELLEHEIPELQEIAELRKQYLVKLEKVMHSVKRINNDLEFMQKTTADIQRRYFGGTSNFDTIALNCGDLRKWIWINEDYRNDYAELERKALRAGLPPLRTSPNTIILPARQPVTQGQRIIDNIPVSEPKILGKADGKIDSLGI